MLIEHAFHAAGDHVGEDLKACLTALKEMVESGADREISAVSCLTLHFDGCVLRRREGRNRGNSCRARREIHRVLPIFLDAR